MHNAAGRQVGRFSLRDDRTLVMFIARSPRPATLGDTAECKARLAEEFGDVGWECPEMLSALDDVEDIYYDVVSQIHLDRWSRGRTALIGPCRTTFSP